MTTKPDGTKVAYRISEIAELISVSDAYVYKAIDEGEIPRVGSRRPKSPILIPAWALEAFKASGDWWHPDFRPAQFPIHENAPAAVTARA
mgnify:CR=1 FL=1